MLYILNIYFSICMNKCGKCIWDTMLGLISKTVSVFRKLLTNMLNINYFKLYIGTE